MATGRTDAPLPERYRTLRRLGRRLGRLVAIKRLHADSPRDVARRFEREARMGASLNHPGIVTVYDISTDEEGVVIVMENVDGDPLSRVLEGGRLEPARAVEIVCAVGNALDHAHESGVIHRDVKPANVLLGRSGAVKLADLGIATAAEGTRLTPRGRCWARRRTWRPSSSREARSPRPWTSTRSPPWRSRR